MQRDGKERKKNKTQKDSNGTVVEVMKFSAAAGRDSCVCAHRALTSEWCACVSAATTFPASGPQSERVATPAPYVDGTLQVGVRVTRGLTIRAVIPVDGVHLPQSHVKRRVCVVVCRICVPRALVRDDALAAALIPAAKRGAPPGDVLVVRRRAAWATGAVVTRAVTPAQVCLHTRQSGGHDHDCNCDTNDEHCTQYSVVQL